APLTASVPSTLAIAPQADPNTASYVPIDVLAQLRQPVRPNPNLPVLTRPSDIACVLKEENGDRVFVPHATLLSISASDAESMQSWDGEPSTFGLWSGLIAGATVAISAA